MKHRLKLELKRLPFPYDDEGRPPEAIWGEIHLSVSFSDESAGSFPIISFQWEIRPFFEWINKNKDRLLSEMFPFSSSQGKPISEMINNLYEWDDEEFESIVDHLWAFKEAHNLWFAFRGAKDMPNIYIGLNEDEHEISGVIDEKFWAYPIDLPDFIAQVDFYQKEVFRGN